MIFPPPVINLVAMTPPLAQRDATPAATFLGHSAHGPMATAQRARSSDVIIAAQRTIFEGRFQIYGASLMFFS